MDIHHRAALPSAQARRAHELNPGGIDPISVDDELAAPATDECRVFRKHDAEAARAEAKRVAASRRRDAFICLGLAVALFAVGFIGGVWACKAGSW